MGSLQLLEIEKPDYFHISFGLQEIFWNYTDYLLRRILSNYIGAALRLFSCLNFTYVLGKVPFIKLFLQKGRSRGRANMFQLSG